MITKDKNEIYVSYYNGYVQKNGNPVTKVKLLDSIVACKKIINKDSQKGTTGGIFPYVSRTNRQNFDVEPSDVLFVDIDHISNEYIDGVCVTDIILGKFNELCSELPNIITAYTSHSYNIHFILYKESMNNSDDYITQNQIYTAVLATIIKKVCGIDLRTIDKSIDTHNQVLTQRFYLNHIDNIYWNPYIQSVNIDKKNIKQLKIEYPQIFIESNTQIKIDNDNFKKIIDMKYVSSDDTKIEVDKDYIIRGWSGYDARTRICSTSYYHFNQDLDSTIDFISSNFNFTNEWQKQFKSLIEHNNVYKFYDPHIEDDLFGKENCDNKIQLKKNEYISDKLGLDDVIDKKNYLCSGTNTGKTYFCKKLISQCKERKTGLIYIQFNRALLEDKLYDIEEITFRNEDNLLRLDSGHQYHISVDNFVRNIENILSFGVDFSKFVLILDESHFMEDYINIKTSQLKSLVNLLSQFKTIVMMSATPKSDFDLLKELGKVQDVKYYEYYKIQDQTLNVKFINLNFDDKDNRTKEPKLNFIINDVISYSSHTTPTILYSNRHWHEYEQLLNDKGVGFGSFRSDESKNKKNICMSNIKENKLLFYPITLATCYLGVGMEIKQNDNYNIEKGNVVFCLDEGVTFNDIIQSIGRFRDVSEINLILYYSGKKPFVNYVELSEKLSDCFNNLTITKDEMIYLNIIAAKHINVYDKNIFDYDNIELYKLLKINNIVRQHNYFGVYDAKSLKNLPYKEVNIQMTKTNINNKDNDNGHPINIQEEKKLIEYLKSFSIEGLNKLLKLPNHRILNDIECKSYSNGYKFLSQMKSVLCSVGNDINVWEIYEYFGSFKKAINVFKELKDWIRWKEKLVVYESWNNETTLEKERYTKSLEKIGERITKIFSDEYIRLTTNKLNSLKNENYNLFETNLNDDDVINIFFGDIKPEYLVGESYSKQIQLIKNKEEREKSGKIGGKISSPKKSITIKRVDDNRKTMTFESKTDCMKYLECSSKTFSKFLKGETKLNKVWNVVGG